MNSSPWCRRSARRNSSSPRRRPRSCACRAASGPSQAGISPGALDSSTRTRLPRPRPGTGAWTPRRALPSRRLSASPRCCRTMPLAWHRARMRCRWESSGAASVAEASRRQTVQDGSLPRRLTRTGSTRSASAAGASGSAGFAAGEAGRGSSLEGAQERDARGRDPSMAWKPARPTAPASRWRQIVGACAHSMRTQPTPASCGRGTRAAARLAGSIHVLASSVPPRSSTRGTPSPITAQAGSPSCRTASPRPCAHWRSLPLPAAPAEDASRWARPSVTLKAAHGSPATSAAQGVNVP